MLIFFGAVVSDTVLILVLLLGYRNVIDSCLLILHLGTLVLGVMIVFVFNISCDVLCRE